MIAVAKVTCLKQYVLISTEEEENIKSVIKQGKVVELRDTIQPWRLAKGPELFTMYHFSRLTLYF